MAEQSKDKLVYSVVRKKNELKQAFSLVYKEYASRGYIPKHYKSTLRLSLFNSLPTSTTFVAKEAGKVVATVTLIPDSPLGLPMDKIYKKELDILRKKGKRISEVSQLSIDSRLFPKGWFSMFNFNKLIFVFKLFKLVLDYGIYKDELDEFCIAVNPRHQYLYKFIGFEELAGLRYYGSVNKAPAIAKHLELEGLDEKMKKKGALYKIFYGKKTNSSAFKDKYTLNALDLEYFFLKKSDILKKATSRQLKYIHSCYPGPQAQVLFKKLNQK